MCFKPSLVLDNSGNPIVTWYGLNHGPNQSLQIYVLAWNGFEWTELGGSGSGLGISNASTVVYYPSVTTDASGNPVVIWLQQHSSSIFTFDIKVKRWTGTVWESMDNAVAEQVVYVIGDSAIPTITKNSAGNPIVSWFDQTSGTDQVYVKHWIPY